MEPDARRLRLALVRKLRRDGVLRSHRVERAFRRVPRHLFLPEVELEVAYRNIAIATKIHAGEPISSSSQPSIMAIMLEQLAPLPGDRVLEVGAGTGYNAALLSELVGANGLVTAIDLDADIVERARRALAAAGYATVQVERQDGFRGFESAAPYESIIATVGLGDIPLALSAQLSVGGRLVMPLSIRGTMKSVAFRKDGRGRLNGISISPASFMPLRGARPLASREFRVGPELGLFASVPQDRGPVDPAALYRVLRGDFEEMLTDVEATRFAIRGGLVLWLRGHLQTTLTLHAEGTLTDDGPVPPLLPSPFAWPMERDRMSIGLWEGNEVALLAGAAGPEDAPMPLAVRAFGGRRLAEQLVAAVRAWRHAGSPSDEKVHLRVLPRGQPSSAAASVPVDAGTLELTWSQSPSPRVAASRTSDNSIR